MTEKPARPPIPPSAEPGRGVEKTAPESAPDAAGGAPPSFFREESPGEVFTSVGEELRRERELRDITLKEIAEETKISLKNLMAIERNEFHKLPGGVYTKNFIRAYCRYLGINEDKVVNNYLYQINPRRETLLEQTVAPQRGNPVVLLGIAGVALLAILIVLAVVLYSRSTGADRPQGTDKLLPGAGGRTSELPTPTPATRVEPPSSLRVVLKTTDQTFLNVRADGVKVVSGIVPKGETYEITAQERIDFEIGNASAISWSINGTAATSLGTTFQPKSFTLTPANVSEYVPAPAAPGGTVVSPTPPGPASREPATGTSSSAKPPKPSGATGEKPREEPKDKKADRRKTEKPPGASGPQERPRRESGHTPQGGTGTAPPVPREEG